MIYGFPRNKYNINASQKPLDKNSKRTLQVILRDRIRFSFK